MIPSIGGWTQVRGVGRLTLLPPEGAAQGRIVYRERVRPLPPLDRILDAELGALAPRARRVALATDEGEHAVHATALTPDGAVRHDVGLIFVDDFFACLHGVCADRAAHERFGATVRALIAGDHHGLEPRRRRYLYTPPQGWQGLARGLETQWLPPDYPRNRSTMSVPPASPGVIDPMAILRTRLALDEAAGFAVTDVRPAEPVAAGASLEGVSFAVTGVHGGRRTFVRELAVLTDTRYTYPLLFDSAGEIDERLDARRRFAELVRSVRPLPSRSRGVPDEIMNLWSE